MGEELLIDRGFNPEYGARPLRRSIENLIEDPLSEDILGGKYKGKDTIMVRTEGEGKEKHLVFEAALKKESPALAGVAGGGEPAGPAKP